MVRRAALSAFAVTVTAMALSVWPVPVVARADPLLVFPGMEIHQDTHLCTLGYVDPALRVAFTAGHCHGHGPVTNKDGNVIGNQATFRNNTPNGSTVAADQQIADYEAIVLADDVTANNVLPGGRVLGSDPGLVVRPGEPVCHFGVVTGESCGTVEQVNNGWFTMSDSIVSQNGDSGGPVYVTPNSGSALIVGMFNSRWGQFPAAVSWVSASQQVREDVGVATMGSKQPSFVPKI
ncbi:hypothetical protein [Mycobacterium xenopi]|uniref:Trypsin domain-containing protein n=2 Tax=Mycobacterium xenopi TaxID=1789 RepID=A0AAD1H107_MYCXE|nr:hypothetical protein [Mycobacterium xenopi]EUA42634.1 hypothetical protein I553_6494 [Mycobacterium xenopi 4042]EID11832.1 hypothetical protein MXEN_14860 [Mycobacterium xenopi RIVM700367]MDA3640141.1 hypothetical protein [Mycobacterium xenopi]MDA3658546.1 hypothetical protein [Mycobacterium xenopi]MDA3662429.1 hypothetical protein [Mycobacterium xenopi]